MIGIYKITSPSGKIYIGQSIDVKRRLREYKKLNCKKQIKLYHSLLKYGFDSHKVDVICECLIEELNDKERHYQDFFNCVENGLNCTLTASKDKSGRLSLEHRKKISEGCKNPSVETRLKMSKGQLGKKRPLESVIKTANANRGQKRSLEFRLRVAEKSKNISDETRRKYSESHIGHKHTDEAKKKISESGKGRVQTDAKKLKIAEKLGIKVLNTKTGEIFLSVTKAANSIGHNRSWLHSKLKGLTNNNTNLIFYINE